MKKCPRCNTKYSDDKEYCRKCGNKLLKCNINKFYLIIGLAVIAFFMFWNSIETSQETAEKVASLNNYSKHNYVSIYDLDIKDWDTSWSGNYTYISGSVKNVGNDTISYYKITAKLLNKYTGEVEDSDYTNSAEDLAPGESRKFEIMVKGYYGKNQVKLNVTEVR